MRSNFNHTSIEIMQGLNGVPDTALDIACIKSAAYEVVSQEPVWNNNTYTNMHMLFVALYNCKVFWLVLLMCTCTILYTEFTWHA